MTGKDLLNGLNFVDEDLIEETGKETRSAEMTEEKLSAEMTEEKRKSAEMKMQSKSGKHSGKIVFLHAAVSAAAGLLIFAAGTAVGSHMAVKPLRSVPPAYMAVGETQEYTEEYTEGIELLGAYLEEESQNALYEGGEAEAMPQEEMAEDQSGEIPVREGMVGVQAENSDTLSISEDVKVGKKIASSQTQQGQGGHLSQLPVTVIGGISVYFYQEENTEDGFFADFEQNNVSYTLQADTLREVVQAAADTICGTDVITIVD